MRGTTFRQVVVFFVIGFAILPLLSGCNPPKDHLQAFNKYFEASDYHSSCAFAKSKIKDRKKPEGEDLLWTLQLGAVDRILHNYQQSIECFDKAEHMLKFYDEQCRMADGLATTAINENALPYRGEEYDGVMVNTYKALNFMAQGNMDLARVEFNRALDRQRRAKEKFSEEIQELKDEIDKKANSKPLFRTNVNNPQTHQLLAQKYPNLYAFEAYPDFVNPFATYLAGIYFDSVGDHKKAIDLLKESHGMVRNNEYIAQDLQATEEILQGNGRPCETVWVIFENGLGPVKKEFRLDIPLFIATSRVRYVGIALPKLEFRNEAYPYLFVEAGGQKYKTSIVASMDRVVQTEFKKDFDVVLQRAIVSATAKALAQYVFEDDSSSAGTLVAVAIAVYSFATTTADVRIWTALPKDFQVARLQKPEDGRIVVTPPGAAPFDVELGDCQNALVYVRIPTREAMPVHEVITF